MRHKRGMLRRGCVGEGLESFSDGRKRSRIGRVKVEEDGRDELR